MMLTKENIPTPTRRNYAIAVFFVALSVADFMFGHHLRIYFDFAKKDICLSVGIMLCAVWAGMLVAISFMEAWLKFRAPMAPRAVALDIGRLIFWGLNRAELFICMLLSCVLLRIEHKHLLHIYFSHQLFPLDVAALLLLLQIFWLQPVLDNRGIEVVKHAIETQKSKSAKPLAPATYHHLLYVAFEVIKLFSLFYVTANHCFYLHQEI